MEDGFKRAVVKELIERIESLEKEKAATSARLKEAYAEATDLILGIKTIRRIIKIRENAE